MPQRDITLQMKILSKRAAVRRIARPSIKTGSDVRTENENFSVLKDHIYREITKKR